MTTITATFTNDELTRLGRAMERCGFSSLQEFLEAAVKEKTEAVLTSTPKQD
jgi:hypothetical protein